MMIPTDRLQQMIIEIQRGDGPHPDDTPEERAMRQRLAIDIAGIEASGGIVDIPSEIVGIGEGHAPKKEET